MPSPEELASPEYQELVRRADEAMHQRRLVVSGHRYQPKIVWTLQPWSRDDLQRAIEAGRFSPFVLLDAFVLLPHAALKWAGAPYWAQYAYLVMVEVKATFGENEP